MTARRECGGGGPRAARDGGRAHAVDEQFESADQRTRRGGRPVHRDGARGLVAGFHGERPAGDGGDREALDRAGGQRPEGRKLRVELHARALGVEAVAVTGYLAERVGLSGHELLARVVLLGRARHQRGAAGRVTAVLAELVGGHPGGRLQGGVRRAGVRVVADDRDAGRLVVETVGVRAHDGLVDATLPALEDRPALVDEEVVAEVAPAVGLHVVDVQGPYDGRGLGAVVGAVRGVVHEDGLDHAAFQVDRALVVQGLVRPPPGARDDRGPRHRRRRALVGGRGRAGGRLGLPRAALGRALPGARVDHVEPEAGRQRPGGRSVAHAHLGAVRTPHPDRLRGTALRGALTVEARQVRLQGDPVGPLAGLRTARTGFDRALDLGVRIGPGHAQHAERLGRTP